LTAYLHEKQILLVLDNFEQVVVAAPLVADLLNAASKLTVLVTSREPLHLSGEHEFPVPPLALPDPGHLPALEALTQVAAVALFIQRAQAVKPDFQVTAANASVVAEICVRLEGLPLAIQLAAARSKLLPPAALLGRLSSRLQLLTGGPRDLPARQQTLRNTIDWSYNLLPAGEQLLFRRLGVFTGGCTLTAAEDVCTGDGDVPIDVLDGLHSLLDKSLIQPMAAGDGEPRFMMLETIREYALEQLDADGDAEALRQRHAAHYLALTEAAAPGLMGREEAHWLARLDAEHNNLRAALTWSRGAGGNAVLGLRLAAALWLYWFGRNLYSEGRSWLETLLDACPQAPPLLRAKGLFSVADLAFRQLDIERAAVLAEESLELFRTLGDASGCGHALLVLGYVAMGQDRLEQAVSYRQAALVHFQQAGNDVWIAWTLWDLGCQASCQGDWPRAREYYEQSLARFRAAGYQRGIAYVLGTLASGAAARDDYTRAMALATESLALFRELRDKSGIAHVLGVLGQVALARKDYQQAGALFEESLLLSQEQQRQDMVPAALLLLGQLAHVQGDDRRATTRYHESLRVLRSASIALGVGDCLEGLAGAEAGAGRPERAARLFGAAEALPKVRHMNVWLVNRTFYKRDLATVHAQLDEATFAAAWAEGRAMTLEQAIAYALEEDTPAA
jgi:predicted ATPase